MFVFGRESLGEFAPHGQPLARDIECAGHTEIRHRPEGLYLLLSLADETRGDALHTSGRERRLNLFPEYGRQLEAHYAVQHAARLLCIDAVHVYVSRSLYGMENGRLGNLMENYAVCILRLQPQRLKQMPD